MTIKREFLVLCRETCLDCGHNKPEKFVPLEDALAYLGWQKGEIAIRTTQPTNEKETEQNADSSD